jgi:sensor histidine kinase YesM
VRNSEYIKKAGNSAKNVFSSLVKLVLTVGILGFIIFIVAIMLGAVQ